ncbi:MAG: hypothetical protein KIG43_06880 [Eubacteriales bacterium]|nr:hypothetical protein [Eubacteriales bacterium]MCI7571010.1 hypothetical protein [Clostridiales bacterium]
MSFFDRLKSNTNAALNSLKSTGLGNKSAEVVFDDIPETFEAFCALPQAKMSTPFDTAALTVVALCVYPANRDVSLQMLDYLYGPRPMTVMDKQFIADRFKGKDYVPRSYFRGATPANDYSPSAPFTIVVSENAHSYAEHGFAKLFIPSGGADSPRPIKLRLAKDGKWYLWEQFLLSDIRQPESANPWA